jgi:SAM-dependent methyltransferase
MIEADVSQGAQEETKVNEAGASSSLRALDLGCGHEKVPGAIGLDNVLLPAVDVLADVTGPGLPFQEDTFDEIHCNHILEHIRDLEALLGELSRVTRPGGRIRVLVPYFSCVGAFGDPTHVRFFSYYTFDHFTEDPSRHTWFSGVRFDVARRHIGFGKLHQMLGVEWWANRWPHIYENFFPYILPGRTLEVELVVPDTSSNAPGTS